MSALVTAEHLRELIDSDAPLRILDVRWRLDKPNGADDYLAGHIPGAVYVDLDHELAAHGLPASEGRHPLPAEEDIQDAARRWGLNDGDIVVAYDDFNSLPSARAWWLLRHAGFDDVRVLDGGIGAWLAAGFETEQRDREVVPGTVTLSYGHRPVLSIDEVAELATTGILIDSRAAERFRGEAEPVDPKAGHIPGAVNVPFAEYMAGGRFLPEDELRSLFLSRGVNSEASVGAYCGSGVTASHTALALEVAGITAAVFPGSWSQWSNTPGRPVATGH